MPPSDLCGWLGIVAGPLPPDKHGLGISEVEPLTTAVWVDVQPGIVPGSQLTLSIQSLANELDGSPRGFPVDRLEVRDKVAVDMDDARVVEGRVWVGSDTSSIMSVDIPGLEIRLTSGFSVYSLPAIDGGHWDCTAKASKKK
ncbi:hypothetical protein G7Y79_00005g017670 [Physcia stellaris]|nr:hypothetical protein G7Y79_00005g017670 [Physcia stellaris]